MVSDRAASQPSSDRATHLRHQVIFLLFAIFSSSNLAGCAGGRQAQNPPAPQSSPAQSQSTSQVSQPQLPDVQEAVSRVFKDAVSIDESRQPSFIAADFNGDSSQDIAVILKPAKARLSDMNQQFPPWILKDPFLMEAPGMKPLQVTSEEVLLAVIHGYEARGWRDPQATQTYLLKNAVGEGMLARSKAEVAAAHPGKHFPQVRGDLIGESVKGQSGYLYFGGATYSWYDPMTFKSEAAPRNPHPGIMTRR
jgi:hypothetical protein